MDYSKIKLQDIILPLESKVNLKMLRLDLIDEEISGNKWFKLKKNIEIVKSQGKIGIITFGGAFSNHIAATASACKKYNLKSIGIIRGEQVKNHTLISAQQNGMELRFVSRALYKNNNELIQWLNLQFNLDEYLIVPEGGANTAGIDGCKEILGLIHSPFNYIALACGTGTTLAGIIHTIDENQTALGFPVLKASNYLENEIKKNIPPNKYHKFRLFDDYHFGGYAKYNNELLNFIKEFSATHKIQLDFVYTAKLMFGLFDLIEKKYFSDNTTIIAVHSGGIQGNKGINI
ncbi:MAG TPA: pyridoxal-phosphate dependent enzyme [Bacteroidia bacterium]|nr:pyridoxal-phosphate dependent enzyme [Bacteroidia bacterium]